MAETYCGKSCTDCAQKNQGECPGCRVGPGRKFGGSCTIAKCSVSKQYHSCEECANGADCITLKGKNDAFSARAQTENRGNVELKRRFEDALLLGRWLMVSFWLCICVNALDLFFLLLGSQTDTALAESLCTMVFQVLNIVVLFKLAAVSERFRLSGIMTVAGLGITALGVLISKTDLSLLVTLAATAVVIAGEYQLFMGLIENTVGNAELSGKWGRLWTVYFICLCAALAGALLAAMGLGIAAAVALAAALGVIVCAIVKIVFLYQTAAYFRYISEDLQYWHLMS